MRINQETGLEIYLDTQRSAELTKSKEKLILTLIEVSGAKEDMRQRFDTLLEQVRESEPQEFERWKGLLNVDKIIRQIVPVYDKYLTKEELVEIVEFYKSDAGNKLFEMTPLIVKESMEVTAKYLQKEMEGQPK